MYMFCLKGLFHCVYDKVSSLFCNGNRQMYVLCCRYDKLKPCGICIHGVIDGFSRKVLWLEAGVTNNNPEVIAGYLV